MCSGPCTVTTDPDTGFSLGSLAAFSNYFTWSNRRYYLFFKILLSPYPSTPVTPILLLSVTKAHSIFQLTFFPIAVCLGGETAGWLGLGRTSCASRTLSANYTAMTVTAEAAVRNCKLGCKRLQDPPIYTPLTFYYKISN